MAPDNYIFVAVALAVVVVAVLVGLGIFVGFQTGRRSFQKTDGETQRKRRPREMSERLLRELKQCLDMADCVVRDADALSVATIYPSAAASREPDTALHQLRKTVKGLAARLEQVCDDKPISSTEQPATPDSTRAQAPPPPASKLPAKPAPALAPAEMLRHAQQHAPNVADLRKHPRRPCPGTFKATIYPPPDSPGGEPVQCTVITRDLSCGGIGIAHTEQLYPRQIIVLHAVTKLLVGEVRWCQKIGERSFIAGCQLVKASG